MTTLPNMGLVLATRGPAGSGLWADVLDANTSKTDAHDHTSGKGSPIHSAALAIDADVSFGTSWAAVALNRVSFSSVAAPSLGKSLFVSDGTGGLTANELYWKASSGNNVKFTSGAALNVAAFVGGIVDDYSSVGAQLGYDTSVKRYTLKQGTGDGLTWAKLFCGGVRIAEAGTTEATFVEQLVPAALASSYAVTWPLALPATTQHVLVSSTGQITFDEGTTTLLLSPASSSLVTGTISRGGDGSITSTASCQTVLTLPIPVGRRVTSVVVAGFGDGAVDVVIELFKTTTTGGTAVYATASITNAPVGWNDTTITPGSPAALASTECLMLRVTPNASGFTQQNIRVSYDKP